MILSRFLSRIEALFRLNAQQRASELQLHRDRLRSEVRADMERMKTRLGEELDERLERWESNAGSAGMASDSLDELKERSREGFDGVDRLMDAVEEMKEWSRQKALNMALPFSAPIEGVGVGVPRFYESHHLAEANELFAGVEDEWLRGTLARMMARMRFAEMTNDVGLLCVMVIQQLEAYAHLALRELYVQDGKWVRSIELKWGFDSTRNKPRVQAFHQGDFADLVPLTDFVVRLNGWQCVKLLSAPSEGNEFCERQSAHDHIFHHRCKVAVDGAEKEIYITSPLLDLASGLQQGQWLRVERLQETVPSAPVDWVLHFGVLRKRVELSRPSGRGPFVGLVKTERQMFDVYSWKEDDGDKWVRGILSGRFRLYPGRNATLKSDEVVDFERGRRRRVDAEFDAVDNRSADNRMPNYFNVLKEFRMKTLYMMAASSSADWSDQGERAQMLARVYNERNRFTHSNLSFQRASGPACSVGEVVDFWNEDILPVIPSWIPHINAWSMRQADFSRTKAQLAE